MTDTRLVDGFVHSPGALDAPRQAELLAMIDTIAQAAPWFTPRMPKTGKPFSVQMTNCGPLGWVSDKDNGYRYQPSHPDTGRPWPPMPPLLLKLWQAYTGFAAPPEACLINRYAAGAKMGSHRDADEHEPRAPVLSISLGDSAVFHVGGLKRTDPKVRVTLASGDIAVLGGPARLAYHGIDKVVVGTSTLLPGGGRINLTLRRVTRANF